MTDASDANIQDRIQVFENMLAADPENELANFTLGKLYLQGGDLEKSERALRRTLELNPKHSMTFRLLGQLLLDTGRNEEAIELLKQGVVLAHEKGEYQPRDQMQEILREAGVTPPEFASKQADAATTTAGGEWVCSRCGRAAVQLEEAPLPGSLGRNILERICQPCWREWLAMSIKVINEYRLNLALPEANQIYEAHMKEFLGVSEDDGG